MKCLGENPKIYHCKIILLDSTELIQEVKSDTLGQTLLDSVFNHLNLVETVYFGLRYLDSINQTHWLDPAKKLSKQLKVNNSFTLYFGVKFYASDPCKLMEEITRYQFFLQVKQDILQGRLPVSFELAAELAAYAVQSELGDYDPRRHSTGYISEFQFTIGQSEELESRIMEIHSTLGGQVPSVAEMNYLEKVKWLDMYGVDLHPVLGEDNIEYFLGLTPSGVIVLRNKTKVGNYFWPRITKVYFKGRYFMLRVRDKNNEESTYGFELPTKQACKHLWKCCVEHHSFFRLMQINTSPLGGFFKFTSKFKHSAQPEVQMRKGVSRSQRAPPQVRRIPSQRGQRRLPPSDGIDNESRQTYILNGPGKAEHSESLIINGVSVPAKSYSSMQRSSSVPIALPLSDSPRSTRSAPWGSNKQRGLYSSSTNPSPHSLRSNLKYSLRSRTARHSSSVDSESSCDGRQHKHHRYYRQDSEYEGEFHKSSRSSQSKSRNRKNRSNSRGRDSGSESESQHKRQNRKLQNMSDSNYELISTNSQWHEGHQHAKQSQNAVIKDLNMHHSGYTNSGMESESELNYQHRKKYRRHSRSRSRSPSDIQKRLPEELRKHFEYSLIETSGLSEEQLKSIPYKKVEVDSKLYKIKHSPNSWHKARNYQQGNTELSNHNLSSELDEVQKSIRSTVSSSVCCANVQKTNFSGSASSSSPSALTRIPGQFNQLKSNSSIKQSINFDVSQATSGTISNAAVLSGTPVTAVFEKEAHFEMSTEL